MKTTKGPINTPFFLTENELRVAEEKADAYRYRLFDFGAEPRAFVVRGPLDDSLSPMVGRSRRLRKYAFLPR